MKMHMHLNIPAIDNSIRTLILLSSYLVKGKHYCRIDIRFFYCLSSFIALVIPAEMSVTVDS